MYSYAIVEQGTEIKFNFAMIGRVGSSALFLLAGKEKAIEKLSGTGVIKVANTNKQIARINKFLSAHEINPVPEGLSNNELVERLVSVFAPGIPVSAFSVCDVPEDVE
jgi:hypothetical protein